MAFAGGVSLVREEDLDDLLPLMRGYCAFYEVAPGDEALIGLMAQDKKVKRGKLTFILMEAIGRAVIAPDVAPAPVREFLQQKLAG